MTIDDKITQAEIDTLKAAHASVAQRWDRSTEGVGPSYLIIRATPRLLRELERLYKKYEPEPSQQTGPFLSYPEM